MISTDQSEALLVCHSSVMHKQSGAALNFKFSNLENEIKLSSALSSLQNCPLTITAASVAAAIGPHLSTFAKNHESSLVMTLFAARGEYSAQNLNRPSLL